VRFQRTEVAGMAQLSENLSYPQRIAHHLKLHGKVSLDELVDGLGLDKKALAPALSVMKARGQVVKLGDCYAMAAIN